MRPIYADLHKITSDCDQILIKNDPNDKIPDEQIQGRHFLRKTKALRGAPQHHKGLVNDISDENEVK